MNLKEHRGDFNRRWKINSKELPKESFRKFKQRVLNLFTDDIIDQLTEESIAQFCNTFGIKRSRRTIIDHVEKTESISEICRILEIIFSLDFALHLPYYYHSKVKQSIKEIIEMSDVNVAIGESKVRLITYPQGEKKLDDELVNQVLNFLNPQSNKHFKEALTFYQKNTPVKSAESLRRCLEEFLRYKLKNEKGLEKNIQTFQKQLKENKGKNKSKIRDITFQTFNYLDDYFNENSKHKDGKIDEPENEFLIYQTGLLMRYIDRSLK